MSNDSYSVYKLQPGKHKISVEKRVLEFGSGETVEEHFEAGKVYFLKQTVGLTAGLYAVSREQALADMPRLKEAAQ